VAQLSGSTASLAMIALDAMGNGVKGGESKQAEEP
jgi:hypothetical protein